MTDDFLRLSILSTSEIVLVGGENPPPDVFYVVPGSLVTVREVTVLPGNRLGAIVECVLPPSAGGTTRTDFILLAEQDGRYLIDGLRAGIAVANEVATPGP